MPYDSTKSLDTGLPKLQAHKIPAPDRDAAVALYQYYQRKCDAAETLPIRRSLELPELTRLGLIGNIFLLEPIPDTDDWRYRLLGTEIISRFVVDRTNMGFRDYLPADQAEKFIRASDDIAKSRKPGFFRLKPQMTGAIDYKIETMSLPIFSNDGGTVLLFGGTFFG